MKDFPSTVQTLKQVTFSRFFCTFTTCISAIYIWQIHMAVFEQSGHLQKSPGIIQIRSILLFGDNQTDHKLSFDITRCKQNNNVCSVCSVILILSCLDHKKHFKTFKSSWKEEQYFICLENIYVWSLKPIYLNRNWNPLWMLMTCIIIQFNHLVHIQYIDQLMFNKQIGAMSIL